MSRKKHLKKIEFLGFKSFADKTSLEFHEGITVIVGPNGCGKSNIADGFRFVLGEQSSKTMRGGKMQDVIFSGANTRKPLNLAEVTLTMTNDGMLPTEYEEVAVKRRVHRSGEGEYFINNKPTRLKDVQDFFMGSGVGKDNFSMIAQNQVERVINNSPIERRFIFEQASGIERFLHRKNEALRKLEQTEANVERVKDIHREVEKQIIVLEEQAEVARHYKENKAELDFLELALILTKWENLQNRMGSTKAKEEEKQSEMDTILAGIESEEAGLHEAKKSLAEGQLELQSKKEEVYKRRSEKEIKSKEWQANQQKLQEVLQKEKRWIQELDQLIEKRKQWKIEAENNQKQLVVVEADLEVLEKSRTENRDKLLHLEEEVSEIRERQQNLHQELVRVLRNESESASELKQDSLRLEHNQERKRHLLDRKERLAEQIHEINQSFEAKKESVESWTESVNEQKRNVSSLEAELKSILQEIEADKKKLDTIVRELTENRARQKVLLRIREQMEGFSAGSKRLLKESTTPNSPLFNKVKGLYESITPSKGSEKALSVVMRPYSQTLVVEKQEDLQVVIQFAKENNLKDYSIVCLDQLTDNLAPKVEGKPLLDQIEDNPISRHFLKNVYIAENAQDAFQLMRNTQGVEVWTQEGAYVDQRGVIFYSVEGDNNIFIREAELNTLEKKIHEKEVSQSVLEESINALSQKRTEIQNRKVELEKSLRQEEMKLVEANFSLQRFNSDLSKLKIEQTKLEEELRAIDEVTEKLHVLIQQLKQKHAEAVAKAEEMKNQEATLSRDLVERMAILQSQQNGLKDIEPRYQKMLEEQRKINHHLHVLEVKELESQQQEKHLQHEIKSMQNQQNEIQNGNSDFQQSLEEVEKLLADVLESTSEFEKEVANRRQIIEGIECKINENRHMLKQLEQDFHQYGIQLAQMEASRQSFEAELNERHHRTMQDLKQQGLVLPSTIEKAEKDVRSLRRKIEEAGDINMTSIEECDKHKERYVFLGSQIEDLEASKTELVEIITQLDTESRKIFKETFDKIQANFKKNYQILFNGGEADLQLTESEDVLEAGIEIIAKPPGKQMRSITLLSGGEKCLTALALLFAIFEVKPSPFCILDEIDAPLDDSNVERFLNVVKQFVDKCQFIIITHNKRTMSIADVIFGVSMQEKGVSKLLSLEFNREKTPEPSLV
jgi:chromosome segregation protein